MAVVPHGAVVTAEITGLGTVTARFSDTTSSQEGE